MPATENRCRLLHLQGGNISKAQSVFRPVLRVVLRAADQLLVRVPVRMPVRMSDHHSDRILSRMVVRTVFRTLRMCRGAGRALWQRYVAGFLVDGVLVTGFREWPVGVERAEDADSGPRVSA